MVACEETSSGQIQYCGCTLRWFEENVPLAQFLQDNENLGGQTAINDQTNAAAARRNELG